MKLTLDNVKAYAIENGYNNLRKCDGKGYYLDYSSYRTTGHYYCPTLKIAVYVIKNGLVFAGCETMELDGVITGLHQFVDQEFRDNFPLNQLDIYGLKKYSLLLDAVDLSLCDWRKRQQWLEFNRLERLKDYCRGRIFYMISRGLVSM